MKYLNLLLAAVLLFQAGALGWPWAIFWILAAAVNFVFYVGDR